MSYLDHLQEETLEAYVMGRLPDSDVDSLEDHLLLCEHCQLRTREAQLDWHAKRLAMQRLRDRRGTLLAYPKRWWAAVLRTTGTKAGWAAALATAAAAAFFLIPASSENPFTYRSIELSAMRGGDEASVAAQASERLRLHLDLTELEKLSVYHVAIVDSSGDLVWESDLPNHGEDRLSVPVSKRIVPGTYWVRLMDTGATRRLLREYPLPLR